MVQCKHCVSSYSGVVVSNDSKLVWYKVNTVSALNQVLWFSNDSKLVWYNVNTMSTLTQVLWVQ